MDAWIARRRTDVRFRNEMRRVEMPSTAPWYASAEGTKVTHHTFSAKTESSAMHAKKEASSHSSSDGEGGKAKSKKKKKRKREDKGGSSTSDGSDGGPCWSDYERVPNTVEGTKGSCRPKGSKKK